MASKNWIDPNAAVLTKQGIFPQQHLCTHVTFPQFVDHPDHQEFKLVCDSKTSVDLEDVETVESSLPENMCQNCKLSLQAAFLHGDNGPL